MSGNSPLPPEMRAAMASLNDELITVVRARAEGIAESVFAGQGIRMTVLERDGFDAAIAPAVAACLEALAARGLLDVPVLVDLLKARS